MLQSHGYTEYWHGYDNQWPNHSHANIQYNLTRAIFLNILLNCGPYSKVLPVYLCPVSKKCLYLSL